MHALPARHILDCAGRNGRRAVSAVRRRHVSLVWRHLVRCSLRARDVCRRSALVLLGLPGVRGMRRRNVLDRAGFSCALCGAGNYSMQGQSSCTPCSAGFYSSQDGASIWSSCIAGNYNSQPKLFACIERRPGSYGSFSSIYYCDECMPGTYSTGSGATSCMSCGPGTRLPLYVVNSTYCTDCNSAYSELPIGSTQCVSECGPGRYAANCAASHVVSGAVCPFGVGYCAKCSAGTYWTGQGALSALSCEPCGPGTFSSRQGQSTCSVCTEGYYLSQGGASVCVPCWAGSFGTASSAVSQVSCIECEVGTYSSISGLLAATRAQRGQLLAASAAQETPQGLRVLPRARPVSPAAMHGTRARQGKGSAATACQGPTLLTLLQLRVLFAQQGPIYKMVDV